MRVNDLAGCMRVRQWTKNTLIFAALVFSRHIHESGYTVRSICAFALFSLVASAVYILNDVIDIERDRQHPVKKMRPIPSGRITTGAALVMSAAIAVPAVVCSSQEGPGCVRRALHAGARAYVAKRDVARALVRTLRDVLDGWVVISPRAAEDSFEEDS